MLWHATQPWFYKSNPHSKQHGPVLLQTPPNAAEAHVGACLKVWLRHSWRVGQRRLAATPSGLSFPAQGCSMEACLLGHRIGPGRVSIPPFKPPQFVVVQAAPTVRWWREGPADGKCSLSFVELLNGIQLNVQQYRWLKNRQAQGSTATVPLT